MQCRCRPQCGLRRTGAAVMVRRFGGCNRYLCDGGQPRRTGRTPAAGSEPERRGPDSAGARPRPRPPEPRGPVPAILRGLHFAFRRLSSPRSDADVDRSERVKPRGSPARSSSAMRARARDALQRSLRPAAAKRNDVMRQAREWVSGRTAVRARRRGLGSCVALISRAPAQPPAAAAPRPRPVAFFWRFGRLFAGGHAVPAAKVRLGGRRKRRSRSLTSAPQRPRVRALGHRARTVSVALPAQPQGAGAGQARNPRNTAARRIAPPQLD